MANIKELQEKLGGVFAETLKLRKDVDARDGKWTAEEDARFKTLNAEHVAIEKQIEEQKSEDNRSAEIARMEAYNKSSESREKRSSFAGGSSEERKAPGYSAEQRSEDRELAMRGWAFNCAGLDVTDEQREAGKRCGINPMTRQMNLGLFTQPYSRLQSEFRSQTVADPTKGGYTTTGTLVSSIEMAMLNFDGVRQAAEVIRTSDGNPLDWPTIDDTSNSGAIVAEGGSRGTATDIAVGQKRWSAYVYTSDIATITRELLQDSAFPWTSIIGELLGTRVARKQAVDFTTGDGAGKPTGIVTAAGTGVSAASATAIVFDDLLGLKHSVDPSYRNGAAFMFHDTILLALKKLKDGNSNYIWKPGTVASEPATIDGDRYYINQNMASTIASAAVTVLYGQLSKYKIRDVNTVTVLRSDEYAWSTGKVAFVAEMRSDGHLLNAGVAPVKKLTH